VPEAGFGTAIESVAERKVAEEVKLRPTSIIESSEDAITSGTLEGVITGWNPGAEKLYGYPADEAVGRTIWEVMDPLGGSDVVVRNIGKVRVGEAVGPFDAVHHARDGRPLHVSVILSPIKDPAGRVTGVSAISRDVTVRRRAEDALRESEERFRSLIQNASDMITIIEADGTIRYESPAVERVLGYRPEERVDNNAFDYVHPDDEEQAKHTFTEALDNPGQVRRPVEFRLRHKNGSWRHMETTRTNLLDDPAVEGVVANSRDITERRRTEEALRESEERFRSAFEDAPIGVALVGLDRRYLRVNRALCEMLGYSEERLLEKTAPEIIHPEDHEISSERVRQTLEDAHDDCFALERRYVHADGHEVWHLSSVSLIRDSRGDPSHFVCLHQDVTERRRMERELRESEASLAETQRLAHLGGWRWDVTTGEASWSNEVFRIYGLTPGEFVPTLDKLMEVVHPDDRDQVKKSIEEAFYEDKSYNFEHRIVRPDGEERVVHRQAEGVFGEEGEPLGMIGTVHDITERKKAEEALRQSEERFRSLVQNSSDVITILDADGTVHYVSPAIERMLGYQPQERMGRSGFELLHPEDLPRARSTFTEALRNPGVTLPLGVRMRHREGSWRDVELTGTNLLDDPAVGGIVLNWRDITEHKQAVEALKESEERFRTAFENAPLGVALISLDGRRFRANRALCEMLGCSEEDLLEDYLEHVHPDDRQISTEHFQRALEEGAGSYELERRYLRADGHVVWNLTSVSLIRDSKENPSHFICLHQDITERKKAEEALRQSEEQFRTIFEDAPIGVALVGLDGRRLSVNRAMCEILGYSQEELLGEAYIDVVHPDDREMSAEHLRRALEGGPESYTLERRYVHAGGHAVWNLTSVSVIRDSEGNPSHLVCLHQDITDRKKLEEKLSYQVLHDSLTGLPNRELFMDHLEKALARLERREEPIAVLFVDLDNFKDVNDSLGHEAGDQLLVALAERLKRCIRPEDTVARLAGDEFVVLLEGVADPDDATRAGERITEASSAPFYLEGQEVFVSVSIGIATTTNASDEPKDLLRNADLALYEAKGKGKAQHIHFAGS
jgi:diguanylate cyclase (GGDEF)-like protein/PAS domain S-box-containing protein